MAVNMDLISHRKLSVRNFLRVVLVLSVFWCCMAKKDKSGSNPPVPVPEDGDQPFDPITVLPGDCLQELFSKYSTDDERLDQNEFVELLHNLGLGAIKEDEEEDHATDHDDHDDAGHHGDHAMDINTKGDSKQKLISAKRYKRAPAKTTSKSPLNGEKETATASGKTSPVKGSPGILSEDGTTTTSSPKSVTNGTLNHGFHTDHHQNNKHVTQCLSAENVINIFDDETPVSGLTKDQFFQVCPVLLQQLDSRACVKFDVNSGDQEIFDQSLCNMEEPMDEDSNIHHVWGYAFAAVTLISMASIVCILVVPCMQRFPILYARLLSFLVAMAVGTLSGDAVMHLMPHAFGFHGHKEEVVPTPIPGCSDVLTTTEGHGHEEAGPKDTMANNVVIKGLVVLMGIFSFFIIEQLMQLCRNCRQKRHKPSDNSSSYTQLKPREHVGAKLCNHSNATDRFSTAADPAVAHLDALLANDEKPDPSKTSVVYNCNDDRRGSQTSDHSQHAAVTICVHSDAQIHISPQPKYHEHSHGKAGGDHKHEHNDHQHSQDGYHEDHLHDNHHSDDKEHHDHHGHSHELPPPNAGIATLAWIVVMGDGLHNFCDGLVVGAAFADSIVGGLSTAIAVMCHELPHELGDFAVMLKAGMSVKQALAFQGVSSILAYIGMAIGVAMGNISALSLWIFALAAGMFLYIALADLFPEMVETISETKDSKSIHLLLQALGVMVGIGLMLTIGLLEEDLMAALASLTSGS